LGPPAPRSVAHVEAATARRQPRAAVDWRPLPAFQLGSWARARLWQAGELDLHGAVDTLQAAAVRDGLVAKFGQDRVQEIIAAAFAAVRDDLLKFEDIESEPTFADDAWSAPGWRDAAVNYHKDRGNRVSVTPYTADELARLRGLMAEDVTLERAWHETNQPTGRAAASTVEALMLALRERGAAALAEPDCQRRLADTSTAQVREILARLMALRPVYPVIDDELLFLLGEQL
jgi:hypothetical protein